MDIGTAIEHMAEGRQVRRKKWERTRRIGLRNPDQYGWCVEPWIWDAGDIVPPHPWAPSHRDILADDWELWR